MPTFDFRPLGRTPADDVDPANDPAAGTHLELTVEETIANARARPRPRALVITDLTDDESDRFWGILEQL